MTRAITGPRFPPIVPPSVEEALAAAAAVATNSYENNDYDDDIIMSNVTDEEQPENKKSSSVSPSTPSSSSLLTPFVSSQILPPQTFLCPITMEVMKNPVMDLDGNSFERKNIVEWLRKMKQMTTTKTTTSPITRNPLKKEDLMPNVVLKQLIHEYMGNQWSKQAEEDIKQHLEEEKRIGKEDEENQKNNIHQSSNRAVVRGFLDEINRATGKSIRLNENGIAAFTYDHLKFVIEVPLSAATFFLYSVLFSPSSDDGDATAAAATTMTTSETETTATVIATTRRPSADVYSHALRLNYLQQDTRGACIGIDKTTDEIIMSYSDRVEEINHVDFRNILENFIDTALKTDKELREKAGVASASASTATTDS